MRDERKIDYTGIYDYAIANQLNYNELCAVVQRQSIYQKSYLEQCAQDAGVI